MNPIAISSGFPEPGLPLSPPLTQAPLLTHSPVAHVFHPAALH